MTHKEKVLSFIDNYNQRVEAEREQLREEMSIIFPEGKAFYYPGKAGSKLQADRGTVKGKPDLDVDVVYIPLTHFFKAGVYGEVWFPAEDLTPVEDATEVSAQGSL